MPELAESKAEIKIVAVLSLRCVWLFETPWIVASQAFLSSTIPQSSLNLMSIELMMPSKHLILCHPLLFLPSIFPSTKVFSNELVLCSRWPNYWSFSFSSSSFIEYSELIFFRIDWFDLLAVQGTLKSLLQHHSLKASIILHSTFFIVQLSHPYMTTGKNIALTIWTFFGKVMSLLFSEDCWEKCQRLQICRWYHSNGRKWRASWWRWKRKEREKIKKTGLTLNLQQTKIIASGPITSWQIDGETVETVTDYFGGLQNHCRWWLQPWN